MGLHGRAEFAKHKTRFIDGVSFRPISSQVPAIHPDHKKAETLLSLLSTAYSNNSHLLFLKFCGTIITLLLTVQCSWTPEVETLIHQNEEGNITLQTSGDFKVPPQHPHVFTESLIKQVLQGIIHTQEKGILQELLISNQKPSPLFTPEQIAFLTPHLVDAFSKATSEELITFRVLKYEKGTTQLRGTIALFPPTIFLLAIQPVEEYPGNSSKMGASSRKLQQHTTITFSQEQAVLNPKEAQGFMKMSSHDSWIAINYANLVPLRGNAQEEPSRSTTPVPSPQSEETQAEKKTLEEQLHDLQKKVDEQAEKIQRLQQATPK
jgi:hypothetical protein